MNQTALRDLLYNLRKDSGASEQYGRGLLVGMIATLIAMDFTWEEAMATVKKHLPDKYREECIPEHWREDLL